MASTTSLVLHGARDLRLESRPIPSPPADHVQVAVLATSLCGSDLHYYLHNRNGVFTVQEPLVLGHEAAGIVTKVGPGVTYLRPGQHVAIEAGIPCKKCEWCTAGRYNLCSSMSFRSSAKTFPHLDGTLQTKINHLAKLVYPLPEGVSCEMGALVEPLSVIIHSSRRAALGAKPNQRVLIFGAGAIGLLAASMALGKGVLVESITMVDINQERLDFAKSTGLAGNIHCITPSPLRGLEGLENSQTVAEIFGSDNDVVFECTGAEACIQMAVYSAKSGGKVLLIGMGTPHAFMPISNAATREVDIMGSFRYANTYKEAIDLLAGGKLPSVRDLITHRVPLTAEAVASAFESMANGKDGEGRLVIKVVVSAE